MKKPRTCCDTSVRSIVILSPATSTLTRMGTGSKIVVSGDTTQIDLPEKRSSGLVEIQTVLKGVKGIKFVYFSEKDVVRHPLVQKIIKAYEKMAENNGARNEERKG